MNILVVHEQAEFRELLSFYLEGRFNINVVVATDIENAVFHLSNDQEAFDALICVYPSVAKKLVSLALAKAINLHFFCITDETPQDPMIEKRKEWVHLISNSAIVEGLELSIRSVFREFKTESKSFNEDFCRIDPRLLLSSNPLRSNIYVRLSDQKFVRIIREGFEFEQDDYNYFCEKKKFKTLYLKKLACFDFSVQIQKNILFKRDANGNEQKNAATALADAMEAKKKRLEYLKNKAAALAQDKLKLLAEQKEALQVKQEPLVQETKPDPGQTDLDAKRATMIRAKAQELLDRKKRADVLAASQLATKVAEGRKARDEELKKAALAKELEKDLGAELEAVQKMSGRLGFTKEVQEITKQSVAKTLKTVRNAPKLSAVLMQLRREKDKYISSHSMMLAYVSCALASQLEWSSDTTFQKLTLAAFLHDVSIQNQELAAIQSLGELADKSQHFTPDEIRIFKEHPTTAAELARNFSEVPPDVDSIIAQHHERPDGSGFPRGLVHARIGPLAAVFIVAHDLVCFLFRNEKLDTINNTILSKFLAENSKDYQSGNFRKVLGVVPKLKT